MQLPTESWDLLWGFCLLNGSFSWLLSPRAYFWRNIGFLSVIATHKVYKSINKKKSKNKKVFLWIDAVETKPDLYCYIYECTKHYDITGKTVGQYVYVRACVHAFELLHLCACSHKCPFNWLISQISLRVQTWLFTYFRVPSSIMHPAHHYHYFCVLMKKLYLSRFRSCSISGMWIFPHMCMVSLAICSSRLVFR